MWDEALNRQLVGITPVPSGLVETVAPGSAAAEAGVARGERVVSIDGQQGSLGAGDLDKQASLKGEEKTRLGVESADGKTRAVDLAGAAVPGRFYGSLDFTPGPAEFTLRVPGVWEPVKLGFQRTWMFIEQVALTVKGMFAKRIDTSTLGGPIAIGSGAYDVAKRGVGTLFYFLAVISVNLAVLNLLPVPVLDGGHLLFLAIEKVKGSPVSPNVQAAAQWAGLLALLALMVFVTKNDIVRLLHGIGG
jgi:regulator of sigma E protease